MTKKSHASSPLAKRYSRSINAPLSARERKELAALAKLPDSSIDTSDIPEIADWNKGAGRAILSTRQMQVGKNPL